MLTASFARDAYGPGDSVDGTITASAAVPAQQVDVELAYCDRSPVFCEHQAYQRAAAVHHGTIEAGAQIPFSFAMPADAWPNWDPAGTVTDPTWGTSPLPAPTGGRTDLAAYGGLWWAVVLTAHQRGLRAHQLERFAVPLVGDPSRFRGPEPDQFPDDLDAGGRRWDVTMTIGDRAPRRGQGITVDVALGKPSPKRSGLRVGLVGEIHYEVESTTTGDGRPGSSSRSGRTALVHNDWRALDGSLAHHQEQFVIPSDVPFSYGRVATRKVGAFSVTSTGRTGGHAGPIAFLVHWKVSVREERTMRRDPHREATIWVRP